MSWGSHLPPFMSFGLHTACSDPLCHCEEKQQVLPHNPQLHDTAVPGTFNTCTSTLKTNECHKIDCDNLHCVDQTGSLIPSTSAVPTSSPMPYVFNLETPSRFENGYIYHPSPSIAPLLQWDAPIATLSDADDVTTKSNQQKHKSSNTDVSTMCKHKCSIADARTMGPSKRQCQNSKPHGCDGYSIKTTY